VRSKADIGPAVPANLDLGVLTRGVTRRFKSCPHHDVHEGARHQQANALGERRFNVICSKTDSSKEGPQNGKPALVPAGMMGDRADVIFATPEEISKMIEPRC